MEDCDEERIARALNGEIVSDSDSQPRCLYRSRGSFEE